MVSEPLNARPVGRGRFGRHPGRGWGLAVGGVHIVVRRQGHDASGAPLHVSSDTGESLPGPLRTYRPRSLALSPDPRARGSHGEIPRDRDRDRALRPVQDASHRPRESQRLSPRDAVEERAFVEDRHRPGGVFLRDHLLLGERAGRNRGRLTDLVRDTSDGEAADRQQHDGCVGTMQRGLAHEGVHVGMVLPRA